MGLISISKHLLVYSIFSLSRNSFGLPWHDGSDACACSWAGGNFERAANGLGSLGGSG
jgi:hypothetical protein